MRTRAGGGGHGVRAAEPEDDPGWFQYFDEAELSAEFGHCLRDLSRAEDAAQYAGRSVGAGADGTFARSDFFATMVLADAYLAAGEPEQACGPRSSRSPRANRSGLGGA